jgi:hypothetical protein
LMKALLILSGFFYFQMSAVVLTLLGLFDLVFNFRRLPAIEKNNRL